MAREPDKSRSPAEPAASAENGSTGASVILDNSAANEAVWGSAFFNPSILVLQTQYSQGASTLNFQNKIDLNGATRTIQVSGGMSGTATSHHLGRDPQWHRHRRSHQGTATGC